MKSITEKPKFYRVPTIAKMMDVSKGHIWGLIKKGTLSRVKLSEQITAVPASEVDAMIEAFTATATKATTA